MSRDGNILLHPPKLEPRVDGDTLTRIPGQFQVGRVLNGLVWVGDGLTLSVTQRIRALTTAGWRRFISARVCKYVNTEDVNILMTEMTPQQSVVNETGLVKGPRRQCCTPICFFQFLLVKLIDSTAAIIFPVYKWPIQYALRQKAYLPNQSIFVSAADLRRKLKSTPILSAVNTSRSLQVRLVAFESSKAIPVPWLFCSP